jgi:glyoxylase-like metal-dependent hydrolase (beta-lactamase superfamily II)
MKLETVEIDKKIFFVRGKQHGIFPFSNSLIIKDRVIFDLGVGIEIVKELVDKVEFAALTHTHPDHCSGAWIFNEKGKRVLSPEGYETNLESLANRFVDENLKADWKHFVKNSIGLRDFEADHYSDGDIILKEPEVITMHIPGHTDDLHVFIIEGRIVYGSDVDLTSFGPWYGHRESNIKEFMKSIEKVIDLDAEIFVSGHEEPVFGREKIIERLQSYLEIFEKRNEILLKLLDTPKTLEQLVELSPFYKKKPYEKEILDYWEAQMIKKHLDLLTESGKILKSNGAFIRN